jgi:uncharacterized protein YyaL (SSP411 family)
MRLLCTLGLILLSSMLVRPALGEEIDWLNDAELAWTRSVSEGRPLLLFITRSNCRFCTKMKSETLVDSAVAAQINADFVPLAIDPKTDPELIKELKITAFPTTLIISPDAVTLDRIKGYLPPREFQKRLTRSSSPALVSQPGRIVR